MALDTTKLDALAQVLAEALAQQQLSLRPASLQRSFRCTGCRAHVQPGHGVFIDAPAAFIVAHDIGCHLCDPCAARIRVRAQVASPT